MVKVYNAKTLAEKKCKEKQATSIHMFSGSKSENLTGHDVKLLDKKINFTASDPFYRGTAAESNLLDDVDALQKMCKAKGNDYKLTKEDLAGMKVNAAQYPGQSALDALIAATYIDTTRRAIEGGDLTSMFATEAFDANSDQTVNLTYFYKYIGKMGEVSGSNDSINLIEQKLGSVDTLTQTIKALGWKDTLSNMLFNKIHDMAKVNQAAADADVDERNAAIIGKIVATTFTGLQAQAADTTTDATYDVLMYNTLRKAIKKLKALKDVQTSRKIITPKISLLCNSANTWDISRVINGQLQSGGNTGNIGSMNLQSLPIDEIIEYDQGITDGYTYGKETLSYAGVTSGTCYLFVPKEYLYVMNKRGLTLDTGSGSVLDLSTTEKAWYRVNGIYTADFLGGAGGGTAGTGAIVKITLPYDE